MKRNAGIRTGLLGGSALALTLSSAALAQDTQPAAAAEGFQSQEIIVTAQRRAEALEDVPMSIAVVTGETLERASITNIHDLGQVTAGVQVNWAGSYTQPAIRGVTALTNGSGSENNVAVYVDGFYEPNSIAINQDLANLANIQILKGPQGTLYGRNATGGAILIETLKPSDVLTGMAEATYARFDDRRIKAYISGPLTDRVRFSIAGYYRKSDGYLKFADPAIYAVNPNDPSIDVSKNAAPEKQASVRTKLEIDLTDNITATFAYNYGYSRNIYGLLYTTYAYRPSFIKNPGPTFPEIAYNIDNYQIAKSHQGTATIQIDTSIGTLKTYFGYTDKSVPQQFDYDGTYETAVHARAPSWQDTLQIAADYEIDAIKDFVLLLGASYYKDELDGDVTFGATSHALQSLDTEAMAFYADGTWNVTDALTVTVGGRLSTEKKTAFYTAENPSTGVVVFVPTTKYANFSKFTPRATIRYELGPRTNVYASYSKGFRSGTYSAYGAPSPALWNALAPESVDAYEVGFKTVRGPIRFEIAGYYYDYKDIHVSVTIPNPDPNNTNLLTVFQNAEGAEIYGLDGILTFSPIEGLNIRASGAWNHARYTDFPNATGVGVNAANTSNISGQVQDWSGKQMARAPDLSATLGFDYEALTSFGTVLFTGNVKYSDTYVVSNPSLYGPLAPAELRDKQRYREADSLLLVNASVKWTDPSDSYWISVFGKNLTDEVYRAAYSASYAGDLGVRAEPRTYGVSIGYQF